MSAPDKLERLLRAATDKGDTAEFFDFLERHSGLPGTRPNLDFALLVGRALVSQRGRADRLVMELMTSRREFDRIVAANVLALRWERGIDARGAMQLLESLAEDAHKTVRTGVSAALREIIRAKPGEALRAFSSWMDGYFQSHVVLDALSDRTLLTQIGCEAEIQELLSSAFDLADASSRASERSQGLRALRESLPGQIAIFASLFRSTLDWFSAQTSRERPETRQIVEATIVALRKANLRDAEAKRLFAALEATAPPPRDPSRIVKGTRKRSKGRR